MTITIIVLYVFWSFDLSLLHQWHTFPLNGVSFPQLLHLIFYIFYFKFNYYFVVFVFFKLKHNLCISQYWFNHLSLYLSNI